MQTFNYTIKDEVGIHARPAGELAKLAKEFESTITLKVGEKEAVATRLMAVMGLCVKHGAEVQVVVEGADEEKAYQAVVEFFENNL